MRSNINNENWNIIQNLEYKRISTNQICIRTLNEYQIIIHIFITVTY